MDKAQEKIAQNLYRVVADHLAQFIDEFNVDIRKPLSWNELTNTKKAFWRKEAENLGYRKLEGKPPLLGNKEIEKVIFDCRERIIACTENLPNEAVVLALAKSAPKAIAQAQRDSVWKWMRGEK